MARRSTHAIRVAIVALLLAVGLNAIAHAGHTHDQSAGATAAAVHAGCGYCATFTGFADAPRTTSWAVEPSSYSFPSEIGAQSAPILRTRTSASPRGPPRF